jgi:hypothetical protein
MKSPTNLSRLGNDRSVAVERTGESRICTDMYDVDDLNENVRLGTAASATYYPHPDLAQTSCFQRVPEVIALKNLRNLRKAD